MHKPGIIKIPYFQPYACCSINDNYRKILKISSAVKSDVSDISIWFIFDIG